MALFSNRPGLERMMKQKPDGRREPEPPALPSDHPAMAVPMAWGGAAIGVCYKELLDRKEEHA